jgi:hypothetical protein
MTTTFLKPASVTCPKTTSTTMLVLSMLTKQPPTYTTGFILLKQYLATFHRPSTFRQIKIS